MTESRQPRKQRKFQATRPLHLKRSALHLHLSKELRNKLGTKKRSVLANSGDRIKIIKGEFAGKEGKIARVSYNDCAVYVEGITSRTAKGTEKLRPIKPANIELVDGDFAKADRKSMIAR